MKSFKSLKFLFVMLFVFVSIACNGAVVDKISTQTINSSNSIVITNKALLGEQVVLTSQQDKLYLHIVNTATDEKREITLVRYNSVVSKHGVTIHGVTKDNEEILILVNEIKGADYLLCEVSSDKSSNPFNISFESDGIGFGNNLQNVNYYKPYHQEMYLIEDIKGALKYFKQWVNKNH